MISSSIPNQNEPAVQQPRTNYAQYPPSHVAFFATPTTDNRPTQTTIEPTRSVSLSIFLMMMIILIVIKDLLLIEHKNLLGVCFIFFLNG